MSSSKKSKEWRLRCEKNFYFNGIDFTDVNNGWAVAEGDNFAYIFHTSDGGTTWELQYPTPADPYHSLMQIDMVNERIGWAVGAKGTGDSVWAFILHTTDGGITWTEEDILGLARYFLMDVDFIDETEGWAVGASNAQGIILHYR